MERIIHGEFWRLNFFFPDTSTLILTHWLHSLPLLYIPEFQFNYCWNRSITLILVRETLAFNVVSGSDDWSLIISNPLEKKYRVNYH